MIEEQLLNYGVLGIWTMFNISSILYYRKKDETNDENLKRVVENNTIAITKVYEVMRNCRK
jgi:hypothetical protein